MEEEAIISEWKKRGVESASGERASSACSLNITRPIYVYIEHPLTMWIPHYLSRICERLYVRIPMRRLGFPLLKKQMNEHVKFYY
jgi:hypothetical protein